MKPPAALATLGGSTIAAAAGIDPYCSRVELYYRLRGELPGPDNDALWWGRAIQPLIFERLRLSGVAAYETPDVELRAPRCKWLVGHPDGFTADGLVVEAKVTRRDLYRSDEGLPVTWLAQVQTYMRLSASEKALVAVYVGTGRLDLRYVDYDARAASQLVEMAADFMALVRKGEPPAPDGSKSARDTLSYIFPEHAPAASYTLGRHEWQLAKELRARREQRDEVERQVRELENRVKAAAGDAELILTPHGTTFATWRTVQSQRLDVAAIRNDAPDIYARFTRPQTTRRFVLQ